MQLEISFEELPLFYNPNNEDSAGEVAGTALIMFGPDAEWHIDSIEIEGSRFTKRMAGVDRYESVMIRLPERHPLFAVVRSALETLKADYIEERVVEQLYEEGIALRTARQEHGVYA